MSNLNYFIHFQTVKLMFIASGLGTFVLVSIVMEYNVLNFYPNWTSSLESYMVKDVDNWLLIHHGNNNREKIDVKYVCGDRFLYGNMNLFNSSENRFHDVLMEKFRKPQVNTHLVIKSLHLLPKYKRTPPWDEEPYLHICRHERRKKMVRRNNDIHNSIYFVYRLHAFRKPFWSASVFDVVLV